MKSLLIILLLSISCFASKFGEVVIIDSAGNNSAFVTSDSALKVTMQDTAVVAIDTTDTLPVRIANEPINVIIDSTDSNLTFVNIGTSGIPFSRDDATNAFTQISYEHHEIHGGSHYFVCDYMTVAIGDSLDFQLTTSNTTEWIHMTLQIEGTQEFTVEIFEGATVAADGTAVTAYNNDRNSGNTTSLALLQEGGTVSATGTRIYGEQSGVAGNVNKARQGFATRDREIILDQNSTYRFVITSGGNGNNLSYCGEWYEHTNKN